MHYQGDLEGQGPVWGYVKGGMGMISFAIADAAQEAGAMLACGVPVARDPARARACGSRTATLIRARTVVCNADPKVALRLLDGHDVPADYRDAPRGVEGPQPRREVQRRARPRCPSWTAAPGEDWPGHGDGRRHRRASTPRRRAFEALRPRRARRRLRRDLLPDRLRPVARARRASHLMSVFGQYAPYELADGTGTRAATRSRGSSST